MSIYTLIDGTSLVVECVREPSEAVHGHEICYVKRILFWDTAFRAGRRWKRIWRSGSERARTGQGTIREVPLDRSAREAEC